MSEFSDKRLVSIVTSSYNEVQVIKGAVLAVRNQDYPNKGLL